MPDLLWSATPGIGDIGANWITYLEGEFSEVATDHSGSIANAPDGVPSLRASFTIGQEYGFNSVCEPLVPIASFLRRSVTLRYDVYLDENVDYLAVCDLGGSQTLAFLTFPGLVGGQVWPGTNGNAYPTGADPQEGDNWSARIRVAGSGKIGPYLDVQNKPGPFGWHRTSEHPLRINSLRGRISTWEQTCVMNTPGASNGRVILKIDGETIVDVDDIEFRSDGFLHVVSNGLRLQAHVQGTAQTPATANFDYWIRNFEIEISDEENGSGDMTKPLRIAHFNVIDSATVTSSSAVSSLPASNLKTDDIGELWRATSSTAWVLADLGVNRLIGMTALIQTNLGLADTAQVRVSTSDPTGTAGNSYNSFAISAAVDPAYAMFVHPIEPAVVGRYIRIDMTGSATIEAGRWMASDVFAPTRDRAFGAAEIWRDPSRRIESLGQATIIDRKRRQRGLRFNLRGLDITEATQLREINRLSGTSKDVLIVTDIASANLGQASVWGLLESTIHYSHTDRSLIEAELEIWERM